MRVDVVRQSDLEPGPGYARLLQESVDRVHEAGGGAVYVGPGDYVITTLRMRSGVELHLERGARLIAFHDLSAYPESPNHVDNWAQSSRHLLTAYDCHDIAITGDGVFDGQDEAFWEPCTHDTDRPYGIFRYTVRGSETDRPSPLLDFARCRNLRLSGFRVNAAPGWALHVFDCDTVSITGVTVRGNPYGPNTDGIGINGSRDVRVAHCDVDTGDDAIIIKSTNPGMECRNVTVTNCVLASNCAALGLGADVWGTIRDVVFSNCVVTKSLRMIQVEMWYPGTVERAVFSGISGRTFPDEGVENERPIYIDIQQQRRKEPDLGRVIDMVFRDILCESRGRIVMTAQDGARIDGVTLDTVVVTVPEIEDPALTVPRATSMQLSNHNPKTREVRAAVVADNVDRLTLRDVEYRWNGNEAIPMHALCLRKVEGLIDESPRLVSSRRNLDRVRHVS